MDALEPFYPERMAQRILGMGDMLTLYEKAQESIKVRCIISIQGVVVIAETSAIEHVSHQSLRVAVVVVAEFCHVSHCHGVTLCS